MKTLLALTDFTKNSENAAKAALIIAPNLNAEVLLYNAFYAYVATEVPMEGGVFPYYNEVANLEKESLAQLKDLEKKLLETSPTPPVIKTLNSPGTLSENLEKLFKVIAIEMVIMGNRSTSGFLDRIFIGSDTDAVLEKSTCPVLIVPEKQSIKQVKRIAFATDFENSELPSIEYLIALAMAFEAELLCVHVFEKQNTEQEESGLKFYQKLKQDLKFPQLKYTALHAEKAANELEQFASQEQIDLLALTRRSHTFFQTLFKKSILKEVISSHNIPLMIFPQTFRFNNDPGY